MARKKSPALDVPATAEEAQALIAGYVVADREAARLRLIAETMIDQIKAERDQHLLQLATANATRFAAIKAWWEAGGHAAAGSGRSAELAGAKLGLRLTPPAVKLARGVKADAVIAWLRRIGTRGSQFLRAKWELDKPAIIKAAAADATTRKWLEVGGVTIDQHDEFFIDTGLDPDALRAELADKGVLNAL